MTNKVNKLTPETLMKIEKDLGKKIKVEVKTTTGDLFEIEMYERVRESLINKALLSFMEMQYELQQRTIVDDELTNNSLKLFDFFLLREISDLPIPSELSIEETIGIYQILVDSNIARTLFKYISKEDKKLIEAKTKEVSKNMKELTVALKAKSFI